MATIEEIIELCTNLVQKHGIELLRIAATKQIALSTIMSSTMCDIKQTIIANTMLPVYDQRAVDAGFTAEQLDLALNSIRLAGKSVRHLHSASKPVSIEPDGVMPGILHNVMYPHRLRVEKRSKQAQRHQSIGEKHARERKSTVVWAKAPTTISSEPDM